MYHQITNYLEITQHNHISLKLCGRIDSKGYSYDKTKIKRIIYN